MSDTARRHFREVMGGPDAPTDVLGGGGQPADNNSDVMSSTPDQPADVLDGGREPPGENPGTMAGDAAEDDSDVLGDEGR